MKLITLLFLILLTISNIYESANALQMYVHENQCISDLQQLMDECGDEYFSKFYARERYKRRDRFRG
ncbi:unnamed protein product [Schistosoma margrebowiei]|uniref:Uncharacterized protein n=2 Tax=Schistosoma TaxID=6181 RepID=A0AA84ZZ48_9TREM|nr:unnamed protein product [Schistosoma mattheei]CAH8620440.1 unnamed protein product [Schistosoma intercalatum]CAH8638852.1 unnamed protein product [Schistosoma bovis]CAH8639834.1 unnamed protein product [Schistosoma curassoni]CAH8640145.1 unnamed protein product [Schistosoma margrebowiei]CAH8654814.1 unnamed protein product [Schistosoma haematobium]CAI2734119.1 unnamed protein product [Schistosoma spindale]